MNSVSNTALKNPVGYFIDAEHIYNNPNSATQTYIQQIRDGLPPPKFNEGNFAAQHKHIMEKCVYKNIKARVQAEKPVVTAQQIANQQQIMNERYDALLVQYQQLLQAYIAEKNAHAQETAALTQLRAEMARISDILKSVGLM